MVETATDKSTIQIVLIAIAVITALLFAGAFWLLDQDKDATTVALLLTPAGTGLGSLAAVLASTRTAGGAQAPPP